MGAKVAHNYGERNAPTEHYAGLIITSCINILDGLGLRDPFIYCR